jgi:hypothetical protein
MYHVLIQKCSSSLNLDVLTYDNSRAMHSAYMRILQVVILCAVTELHPYHVPLFPCQYKSNELLGIRNSFPNHCMQGRIRGRDAVKANATLSLGFKCRNCNGEFASRRAMDCHRRHATSVGTPCADPRSYKSLSFTGRPDMSTGILRQHDAATLGVSTQLYITHNRIIVIIVKHAFNRTFNSSIIAHNVSSFP